jgi:FlaA1/EpsC-like NDP-sugar epimerase
MIEELAPVYGYSPEDIHIELIGSQPGEKLYEELMSQDEASRSIELESYFSVLPAFRGIYQKINYDYPGQIADRVPKRYVSSDVTPLTRSKLRKFMYENNLLSSESHAEQPDQRYFPGEKDETTKKRG